MIEPDEEKPVFPTVVKRSDGKGVEIAFQQDGRPSTIHLGWSETIALAEILKHFIGDHRSGGRSKEGRQDRPLIVGKPLDHAPVFHPQEEKLCEHGVPANACSKGC